MVFTREDITKLYCLEAKVELSDSDELIETLYHADDPQKIIDLIPPLDNYFLQRTVEHIRTLEPSRLRGQTFYPGRCDPKLLLAATDYQDFFRILLEEYPKWPSLAQNYLRVFENVQASPGETGKTPTEDHSFRPSLGLVQKVGMAGGLPSELQPQQEDSMFGLLKIIVEDFKELQEAVTYFRIEFLTPYLPALLQKRQGDRQIIIAKMLHKEYPFVEDYKDRWVDEIHGFGAEEGS